MLTVAGSALATRRMGLWTAVVACCDESYTFHFCRDQSSGWNLHPLGTSASWRLYFCRSQSQGFYFCYDQSYRWGPRTWADYEPAWSSIKPACTSSDLPSFVIYLWPWICWSVCVRSATSKPQIPPSSALSFGQSHTEMTSSLSYPTKRRPKAPTLRERDWEPYKDIIVDMHISQGMSLPKVRSFLEAEHGFVAGLAPLIT